LANAIPIKLLADFASKINDPDLVVFRVKYRKITVSNLRMFPMQIGKFRRKYTMITQNIIKAPKRSLLVSYNFPVYLLPFNY